jgi:hypothetical protein
MIYPRDLQTTTAQCADNWEIVLVIGISLVVLTTIIILFKYLDL